MSKLFSITFRLDYPECQKNINVDELASVHSSRLRDRRLLRSKISGISELQEIYSIGEVLGKGNFGTVVKAFHKETKIYWAIKIVNKGEAGASRVRLVEREILILKLVQHPNIIYLDCVFESPKIIYLVFELCMSTLAKLFKMKNKRFEENETIHIIRSLSRALAYLHKNDIVHRDLKLENILIAQNAEMDEKVHIKISDFGLSAMRSGPGHEKMLHEFCGTLAYMAPEVIATKSYSQQCDVWSMGVIMHVLLFGNFPFFSHDENKLCKLISKTEIIFSGLPCSEEARNLLSKLLEKNPAFRATAAETEQHPWISGSDVTLKTQSSNVLHMMRMWKNEMLETSTKGDDDSDMGSTKLFNIASTKGDSMLSDWDQSSANSSDLKPIKQKYWLKPPNTAPPQEIIPSTSRAQQPMGKSMSRVNVNFRELKRLPSSKQHLEKDLRANTKLPNFSYVLAKVDTNLKTKNPGKKNNHL